MKNSWVCLVLAVLLQSTGIAPVISNKKQNKLPVSKNLFIITTDGFRWQEVFNGADSLLINSDDYTPDKETVKALYWAGTADERREKLMPFFWNVIGSKGQIFGNRFLGNKVNTANYYSISYPGYNELFTGNTDPSVSSNAKYHNPNINVFEYLNSKPEFRDRIAIFTSWDVFPYILNSGRNHLPVNSGYKNMNDATNRQKIINTIQSQIIVDKTATRYDQLTFLTAKEYLQNHSPRLLYLSLGETDEFAHHGRYDLYLDQAKKVDNMIAELWHWAQTTPGYKDNTTFIITTDHGRGSKSGKWTSHGEFIKGSSQTWFAIIGPGISPMGEIRENEQFYQSQMAETIAGLLGEEFSATAAPAIVLK
jgi:hypothetical protein